MRWAWGWRWIRFLVIVAGLAVLGTGWAQASVNLPLHHWSYEAIERLTALGVIDRAMVVAKPYSRKQAAKYVARAIERIRSDQVPADGREVLAEPLLERLMQFLQPELVEIGAISVRSEALGVRSEGARTEGQGLRTEGKIERGEELGVRIGGRLQVEGDAFSVGHGSVRLRENRMGQYYANGEQAQTDLRGWVEVSDYLALTFDPKYISNAHALGIGAVENNHNAYLQEFNAKLTLFNVAVQAGRSTNWWGPGYRGSLLLTDHAFPLDMVQVGSEQSFRLPWVLSSVGEWRSNKFLTQLERDRDSRRAEYVGLRLR